MKSKEIIEDIPKKSIQWKSFWKEQIFLCILAGVSLIAFLIIYFVLSDEVYLYLSLFCPLGIAIWIGGEAIVWYLKGKKRMEEE